MNIAAATSLEGFICPACLVDFPGAVKLQDHWLNFHAPNTSSVRGSKTSNDYEEILDDTPSNSTSQVNRNQRLCDHVFKSDLLALLEPCGFCGKDIDGEGKICKGCNYHCHDKCERMVKGLCNRQGSVNLAQNKSKTLPNDEISRKTRVPSSPKNLVTNICHHMRHRVSRNRVRHVDEHFDLDLTYITDRIIAMSFPASGLETTYRNNLREVAKLLQKNHQDKYMVFNLSERRYDISKLNHQVLDFGWPDHLAPPLERLCSIIKSIDSWLKSDPAHVVVVHCKGGKGRTGVVIAAYMHFSKICSSPQAALDWFAMKRFYDDSLGGVTQPSQRRYVHYFSDYLDGKIKLNTDPIFLHHVIIHGIPSFDARDGCKPFLRVYDGLKLIYTSGVFHVTPDMERICITIEGGLILHGDVLIKCYHKNTLSSGRDIIFRCQFHTGAIVDHGLVLDKTELDDACKGADRKFPDDCKVEFVFSATGNFVSEFKDNERLRSIIRYSLQPMENPDTVLYPEVENWYDTEGSSSSPPRDASSAKEDHKSDYSNGKFQESPVTGTGQSHSLKRPPEYVAGPVNGHLYAQVDKAFIKKVRSLSLDSGSPVSIGAENSHFFENKANTLTRRHAHGFKNGDITTADVKLSQPRLQYTPDTMQNSTEGEVVSDEVKSIDRLLLELGECSDILDSTIQQAKPITRDSDVSAPGVPVRNTSFNAGMRYQRNNGVPRVSQGHHLSRSTPNRSPVTSTAFSQSYSWTSNQRTEKIPNGIFGESPSFVLHEAPISQTSPPLSPQTSPKFYATQIAPRTFKATTYTHTTVGYNPYRSPGNGDSSSGGFVTNGVLSIADDWTSSHPDFIEQHVTPSSSIDGISLDEGVESKGSTDETAILGVSPSVSSDGQTDSAFGESIISTSPYSTPVAGHLLNRFNQGSTTLEHHGEEADDELRQRSGTDRFRENAEVHAQEAREDEEAGYARLEDICSGQSGQASTQSSSVSGTRSETQTTLMSTRPVDTLRIEESGEKIVAKDLSADVEAIQDILSEMADMSVIAPESAHLSRSSTPHSISSGGLESRSPVLSSGSGVFENETQRKKSQPHSDKGYGSTTSVSSGSSGDNVFLSESPKVPGLKFDRDTSSFWYKPNITRNDAISILRDSEPGSFVIRDSQSFPGAFGLAVKVAVPPAHVLQGLQGDMTKVDLDNELVRHFLIETTKRGVRLKGLNDEPVFGSLAAFVYQHSITPLALPIRLTIPSWDLSGEDKTQSADTEDGQSWPKGAVGSLMYLGQCDVEMLTGASAIQRTVERLSTEDAAKKFTTVSFKVTPQGMTVTDNERKVFFRQHFHMKSILYCGIDPSDKRWDLKTPTYCGKSKSFGLVLRKTGGVHNECHLFGEISKDWPSSILVNILNRSMTSST
ncbi:tensin-3-like isoform X7 [Porites lutea]|uniref:tensin-3-like isoform X7 n=1 Tax=Porites lutea TaxID=51062 RepID=UPI003CC619E3